MQETPHFIETTTVHLPERFTQSAANTTGRDNVLTHGPSSGHGQSFHGRMETPVVSHIAEISQNVTRNLVEFVALHSGEIRFPASRHTSPIVRFT